jgi:hypothetical protein
MGWATFWATFTRAHLITLLDVMQGCQMVRFQTKNPNLGKF